MLSKRPTPDQSMERTADYCSSPAKRCCKAQASNHITGEHVTVLIHNAAYSKVPLEDIE